MQEVSVDYELVRGERKSQEGGARRRIAEVAYDFSQVDFTEPEIHRRIKAAYPVLLKYRVRPIQTSEEV